MKRKDFLKGVGLTGLGMVMPGTKLAANQNKTNSECVLIPSETAGPFPLDLTENDYFFRQDIREDREGVQLNVKLKINGLNNCAPMQNVRVNIWHCDKDGNYSGYGTETGQTYLRGYQIADVNGEVEFITIFPGWYTGRICHIHFQVFVSSSYSAVSQLTFPIEPKNLIYTNNSALYAKGEDPLGFLQDGIFADGYEIQLATLEENAETGGYTSYMEVAVQGDGTTGIGHIEKQTAKVFDLGQNFPNPYVTKTTIPVTLKQAAQLKLELWDLSGKKLATVIDEKRAVGYYEIEINPKELGLSVGNYVYQIEATTDEGVFRMPKMMSMVK